MEEGGGWRRRSAVWRQSDATLLLQVGTDSNEDAHRVATKLKIASVPDNDGDGEVGTQSICGGNGVAAKARQIREELAAPQGTLRSHEDDVIVRRSHRVGYAVDDDYSSTVCASIPVLHSILMLHSLGRR
jgi:hypothetical protein